MAKTRHTKRLLDEEKNRQAQLWWTFGVGLVLALMALSQSAPSSSTQRTPAESSSAATLQADSARFRQ
ncbi:MAG: hypothetical protein ACK5QT_05205 [Oligoflexia bacterium]